MTSTRSRVNRPTATLGIPEVDLSGTIASGEAASGDGRPVQGKALFSMSREREERLCRGSSSHGIAHHRIETAGKVKEVHMSGIGHCRHHTRSLREIANTIHSSVVIDIDMLDTRIFIQILIIFAFFIGIYIELDSAQ